MDSWALCGSAAQTMDADPDKGHPHCWPCFPGAEVVVDRLHQRLVASIPKKNMHSVGDFT